MFQGNETNTPVSSNWRGYRIAAWIGQFFLAIATAIVLVRTGWQAAIILLLFLLASFIFVWKERQLPTLFDLLFVIAALLNALGWIGLFYQPGPYDEIVHAYTTFSITLALSFIVYQHEQFHRTSQSSLAISLNYYFVWDCHRCALGSV